jgi:GH18 family chitinase
MKVFMQLGSWDNTSEWSGEQFSRTMSRIDSRERFVDTVIWQMKNVKFDGVLFSWTYPGCPRVKSIFM